MDGEKVIQIVRSKRNASESRKRAMQKTK